MCFLLTTSNSEVELNDDPGLFNGSTTNRKYTDIFALIIMVLFLGTVSGLTAYCLTNSDIDKLLNGYDECGNICGKNNTNTTLVPYECFGENMEKKKYNLYTINQSVVVRECVENCSIKFRPQLFLTKSNLCVTDKNLLPFIFNLNYGPIFSLLVFCVLYSFFVNVIYYRSKFSLKYTFCFIFIYFLAVFLLKAFWKIDYNQIKYFSIYFSITWIIFIVTIVPLLCHFRWSGKADLVTQLYQETKNVLDTNYFIWLLPILSSIAIIVFFSITFYCFRGLLTYSSLEKTSPQHYDYVQYPIGICTQVLLIYTFLLLCEFVKNTQNMIIAGYVAQWYFTKNILDEDHSMMKNIKTVLKYHLGTVCFGSFILSITFPLRIICLYVPINVCRIFRTSCYGLFTRYGFTMTAIHGCNFCTGSIMGHKLLCQNIYNAFGIRALGEIIFIFFKLIICTFLFINCFIYIRDMLTDIRLMFIFLSFCTILFIILMEGIFSVLEVTMDTIFLCFCEDCLYNNGTSAKPYYMSGNLAEFMEKANKYVDENNWNDVAENWNRGPRLLY